MKKYQPYLWIGLLVLLYLGSIWQRPLFLPDETRYSEIPREMIASGDFVVPRLDGFLYFEKPVMGYWLNAVSQLIFGECPGAVRFMGALGTLLTALMLFLLCRRAGEARLGKLSAVVFLFSGLVFGVGTYGVLDAQFCFFIAATMTAFYYAWTEKLPGRRCGYLILAGIAAGCAFLCKGLLAFALPVIAVVPFMIWQKDYKRIFTLPWIPLVVALLVIAPWTILIHRAEPDFWRQFLYVEHFQRALTGEGASDDRGEPFWFYIPVVLGGLLPWLLFLPTIVRGYRAEGKLKETLRSPLLRFMLCSSVLWFFCFTIASGKLATYVLPCFPGFACLLSFGFLAFERTGAEFRQVNRILNVLVFSLWPVPVAVFALQAIDRFFPRKLPADWILYQYGELYYIPVIAVVLALIYFRLSAGTSDLERKLFYFCVSIVFIALAIPHAIPWRFGRDLATEKFIAGAKKDLIGPETIIMADDRLAVPAAWALKRSDIAIFHKAGELSYGLSRPEGAGRFYAVDDVKKALAEGKEILVLTGSKKRFGSLPGAPRRSVRPQGRFYMIHYPAGGAEQ